MKQAARDEIVNVFAIDAASWFLSVSLGLGKQCNRCRCSRDSLLESPQGRDHFCTSLTKFVVMNSGQFLNQCFTFGSEL